MQACFLQSMSLITTAKCVNSTKNSLDSPVFEASWLVAVEMENNDGVSFLTID